MEIKYLYLSTSRLFVILAFILFIRRSPNKHSNVLLGVLLLLIAAYSEVINLHFLSVHTKNISQLSYYLPLDALLLMLMSPCLYFYVLLLLNRTVKLMSWKTLLHVLPLLPCAIFNVLFYCRPVDERVNWLIHDFYYGSTEMILINLILYLQIIYYLIRSYQAVRIQTKTSIYVEKNGFRTDISWVMLFLLVNIIVVLISLPLCFWIHNEQTNIYLGQAAMDIDFLFLFIMKAFKNGIVDVEKIEEKKVAYQLNEEQVASYWKTLTDYMAKMEPYLDEDCSLHSLAEQTNIPEHHLSNLLHAHGKISFADFINKYRLT